MYVVVEPVAAAVEALLEIEERAPPVTQALPDPCEVATVPETATGRVADSGTTVTGYAGICGSDLNSTTPPAVPVMAVTLIRKYLQGRATMKGFVWAPVMDAFEWALKLL